MSTVDRGREYEDVAEAFLRSRGYNVVDRNVRFMRKEIDLVVERDGLVAFVEVKGRSGPGFGHPLEAITWKKRRAISIAARLWISRSRFEACSYRFDAVAIVSEGGRVIDIEHVEGAWTE
jgi:putative endonuclease